MKSSVPTCTFPIRRLAFAIAMCVLALGVLPGLSLAVDKAAPVRAELPSFRKPWARSTPEAQGFVPGALEKARAQMKTDDGQPFTDVRMIVIRHGYDVFQLGNPYVIPRGTGQKDWASCGRSLLTTMFGMIMYENDLTVVDLDRPAREVFRCYTAGTLDAGIKGKHLLSYTACAKPPGSAWNYACHYFTMHKIVRDLDGDNPKVRLARLAQLIEADWRTYEYWGHGLETPFLSIVASESEAARWGHLWLHRGNWKGRQIVAPEFVDYSVQPMPSPLGGFAHGDEGLQIHLNTNGMWGKKIPSDAYAAFGAGGKIIFVCPSLDLVVAVTTQPSPYARREVGTEIHRDIRQLFDPIIDAIKR